MNQVPTDFKDKYDVRNSSCTKYRHRSLLLFVKPPTLPRLQNPRILTLQLRPFSSGRPSHPTIYPSVDWSLQRQTQIRRYDWGEFLADVKYGALRMSFWWQVVPSREASVVVRRPWWGGVLRNDLIFGKSETLETSASVWFNMGHLFTTQVSLVSLHRRDNRWPSKYRHSGVSCGVGLVGWKCCRNGIILRNTDLLKEIPRWSNNSARTQDGGAAIVRSPKPLFPWSGRR